VGDLRDLRQLFDRGELRLGTGELGGKAAGLVFFNAMLAAEFDPAKFPRIDVGVPPFAVVGTDAFDELVGRVGLDETALAAASDPEIAAAFQAVSLPETLVAGLRELLEVTDRPLAVRSSSRMEDAVFRPFAGVYETKMLPNNQSGAEERLRKLIAAIKLIYATTFFRAARGYVAATGKTVRDEKMGVVLQEVVGTRHGDRFYPLLSGVARSYNFYPTGGAKPEEG
jgi:phosphoenolpyruvate synthase/pyruvate phosphate dikinase